MKNLMTAAALLAIWAAGAEGTFRSADVSGRLSRVENVQNYSTENFSAAKIGKVENPRNDALPLMPAPLVKGAVKPEIESQWKGKKVAFLGDSITDKIHVGTTHNYWDYLPKILGLDAYVYGRNGWQMKGMLDQAKEVMRDFHWYVDALFVFAGTNDYNGSVPRGEWYETEECEVNRNGVLMKTPHRRFSFDPNTFRGRINRLMDYLKRNFPDQQIVLMTAIHRGYATFGPKNVQPDELYPNKLGLYIDDYNDDIRAAGRIWSVPVLDLYARSGLFPLYSEYARAFHDADTDMLHPNATGHARLARTMAYWMLTIPSDFKRNDGTFE